MLHKKADGLSMNFIVILAISLVVMLVIIGIFGARSREGNQNLRACEARNGECIQDENGDETCPDGRVMIYGAVCSQGDDYLCCMKQSGYD